MSMCHSLKKQEKLWLLQRLFRRGITKKAGTSAPTTPTTTPQPPPPALLREGCFYGHCKGQTLGAWEE